MEDATTSGCAARPGRRHLLPGAALERLPLLSVRALQHHRHVPLAELPGESGERRLPLLPLPRPASVDGADHVLHVLTAGAESSVSCRPGRSRS